jgi:hypothetical protein
MDDKTKQMLDYFGIYDEVVKHGQYVTVSKVMVLPNSGETVGKVKAFVRIILAVSDDPQAKGNIV